MNKQEIKFNIPKDKEDKRKLLIDLENNVGVILREESNYFVVTPYKSKQLNYEQGRKDAVEEIFKEVGKILAELPTAMDTKERIRSDLYDYFDSLIDSNKDKWVCAVCSNSGTYLGIDGEYHPCRQLHGNITSNSQDKKEDE